MLQSSPKNIITIKTKGIKRAGYAARMAEIRNAQNILVGSLEGKGH
jgi:hypothetical protein